jgi:hypothetical protein
MAGRQASQAITRYAGIQVQTSALGMVIPQGWGTFRCRCNLVDYFNFQSRAQKAQAGKGGQTTTGFTYSASLVLAICQGPIDAVTQAWVDGKQYAHGSNGSGVPDSATTSALAQAGLTLAAGAIGQAPWAGLPASHQIGYSGLAIAHAASYPLGTSAATPNHSFEVVNTSAFAVGGGYAGPDVDPSKVVADFFANPRTGVPGWPAGLLDAASLTSAANSYQKYTVAAGLLVSPNLDQQRSATDFLNELLLATNSTVVWSEGLLKFIPYGDATLTGNGQTFTPNLVAVYSLGDDDFIVKRAGDAPLTIEIEDQSDAYNVVQFEYLDRSNQYNMAIALASDAANAQQYGMRRKDPDTVHCICTPAVAAIAAQLSLQRTLYVRAKYRFKLSWAFALLEPGDLVELTDAGLGLSTYTVRITQIDEDETDGTLDIMAEDFPLGIHSAPLYSMQASAPTLVNQAIDPGGVEANLLLWTGDLTQSVWGKTALTIGAGAAADPVTGAGDATKLIPSTATSVHQVAQGAANTFADANYTQTIYAKSAGYSQIELSLFDLDGNAIFVSVDLNTGAILGQGTAQVGAGAIGTEGGSDIQAESGGRLEQDP